jgi:phage shock protein PspC (stress-responsive transcriptional regulator)
MIEYGTMHPDVEKLIDIAATSESITERQREIIRDKAISLGEDPDEAEMILDLKNRIQKQAKNSTKEQSVKEPEVQIRESFDVKVASPNADTKSKIFNADTKVLYGVCAKIAHHFDIKPLVVRLILVGIESILLFLAFEWYIGYKWPLIIIALYVIAGVIIQKTNS